ncbi:MAG: FkbM family methyltransferase [Acidobacteriota bacterium]|nr:FkbM family methyltransferase [Acidobacteriota bacterium]
MKSIKAPIESLRRRLAARRSGRLSSPFEVERAEQIFYLNFLGEGMTVFDAGANVGEMTLLFSRFVGTGIVHAFEPASDCFDRLTAVCRETKRNNVVLNRIALADRVGMQSLHIYDEDHLGWSSLANRPLTNYGIHVKAPTAEQVSVTTIDAYCEEQCIEYIDLLKIDVEGAEYQVMLGARKMMERKRIRCLAFEFGQTTFDMGNSPHDIELYLKRVGYGLRNIIPNDPTFPGRASVEHAQFSMHIATI